MVQGCKFHQQLLPRFVETDVGCKTFYKKITGDEVALFVGQRIDDGDFLFGCQIIRFGKSHGGEVFAPQASEHDVIENVVFQLGKRRRSDLLVADDLPDGFDGFFVCEFRVADFLLLKAGNQFPGRFPAFGDLVHIDQPGVVARGFDENPDRPGVVLGQQVGGLFLGGLFLLFIDLHCHGIVGIGGIIRRTWFCGHSGHFLHLPVFERLAFDPVFGHMLYGLIMVVASVTVFAKDEFRVLREQFSAFSLDEFAVFGFETFPVRTPSASRGEHIV